MAERSSDTLHGNVPDQSGLVLLVIDMISEFNFPGAETLIPAAQRAAERIAALKGRAKSAGVATVYVNDNFGKWQSDFRKLVDTCLSTPCSGRPMAELLRPDQDDYFVLKPKHSAFFATPLDLLLECLGATHLILTGVATNSCVLYTAADAYMRGFQLSVPRDCTAATCPDDHESALVHLERMLKADTRPSVDLPL